MTTEELLALCQNEDFDGVESARNEVDDLDELLPAYWKLDTWMPKVAFACLVQDQSHDGLRAIMLDVLRAPPDDDGDFVELTKAIALGFVDEKYDTFNR